ncbi:MAG: alpha/beta hydrolase [Fimbriimonadaceae bacterium]
MIAAFFAMASGLVQEPVRKSSLTGDIRVHEAFESKILGNNRTIRVWLPQKYDAKKAGGYPVIYFCDGQNVFDGMTSFIPNQEWRADETAQAMVEAGLIPPVVLVAIDNAGMKRADEYLPTKMTRKDESMGGEADKYGDFLVKELKPFVASHYAVSKDSKKTGMVGSSFGGIVTFYLGTTRPKEFGLLGVMSPSFWWDDQSSLKAVGNWKTKPDVKIWMDMGLEEGKEMTVPGRAMRDALIGKGFEVGKNFRFYEELNAGHNERAWAGRLDLCLQFLLSGIEE